MSANMELSFKNNLDEAVVIFDAFNTEQTQKSDSEADFFGALTEVGTTQAESSSTITPIHEPVSTYIIYDTHNNPIKRVFSINHSPDAFEINQSDVEVIKATQQFVKLMQTSPKDNYIQDFKDLLKSGKANSKTVNAFFQDKDNKYGQAYAAYKSCTYISYMLVVVALARTPATRGKPVDQQNYSLSMLLSYMGFDWPSELPDIIVSNFFCTEHDDMIHLGGKLNIKNVTFADGVMEHVTAMLPSEEILFSILFDYKPGLAIGFTELQFQLPNISIPTGGGKTLDIDKPTISLSISPLFMFVVFKIKATIPFTLFNSPTIDADVSMVIDNVEAEIGIQLEGDKHPLLTPPAIKGLHFDSVGVGMGLFFEPPGFVMGLQGQFHIGEQGKLVALDDDTYAVVCEMEEEVPNPLYIAFYVPKLDLDALLTLFTDTSPQIDIPVSFRDLSFRWAENPMQPVTLPDGSLAPMGYGFSAYMDLFGFNFYGDVNIDLNTGLNGTVALSPVSLAGVVSLSGDGKGVSLKVDSQGNIIKNNYIPKTAKEKEAVEKATTRQLVKPGGAEMSISTSSLPVFTLGAKLKFLEFYDAIDASIDKDGIRFDLDFGGIIAGKMHCRLKDWHNFSGAFAYGPDLNLALPLNLGHIHLTEQIGATITLAVSTSEVAFTLSGSFDFDGLTRTVGPLTLKQDISGLSDAIESIGQWIESHVTELFSDLLNDAEKWARNVYAGVIVPAAKDAEYVARIFKDAFNQDINAVGGLLRGSDYALNDVASALKSVYNASATEVSNTLATAYNASSEAVTTALHEVGYTANEIAGALKSTYHLSEQAVAEALKGIGFGANVIAGALKSAFNASEQVVVSALKGIGYGAEDAVKALSDVFGNITPKLANSLLQGAGYSVNAIKDAFESLGGDFGDFAKKAWDEVKHHLNPKNW